MNRSRCLAVVVLVAALAVPTFALAGTASGAGSAGGGVASGSAARQRYAQLWDSGRKETVTGTIAAIEEVYPAGQADGAGMVLRLQTGPGRQVLVHLGPAWAVAQMLPNLQTGQQITVAGSAVNYNGQEVLIAQTIVQGGRTASLRDAEGKPQWDGGWENWGGWGPGSRYGRLYNPATVTSIEGQVLRVGRITPMNHSGQGLGIVVRTAQGRDVVVHLAPAWYVQQLHLEPKVGDRVRVTGSMVQVQRRSVMLASVIDWHNNHIELRAANGQPFWAAGARTTG